jgi:alkylated DNA nucleotide flippase Atl1
LYVLSPYGSVVLLAGTPGLLRKVGKKLRQFNNSFSSGGVNENLIFF